MGKISCIIASSVTLGSMEWSRCEIMQEIPHLQEKTRTARTRTRTSARERERETARTRENITQSF